MHCRGMLQVRVQSIGLISGIFHGPISPAVNAGDGLRFPSLLYTPATEALTMHIVTAGRAEHHSILLPGHNS